MNNSVTAGTQPTEVTARVVERIFIDMMTDNALPTLAITTGNVWINTSQYGSGSATRSISGAIPFLRSVTLFSPGLITLFIFLVIAFSQLLDTRIVSVFPALNQYLFFFIFVSLPVIFNISVIGR